MSDTGFCRAVSQRGATVTFYAAGRAALAIPKRDGDFVFSASGPLTKG